MKMSFCLNTYLDINAGPSNKRWDPGKPGHRLYICTTPSGWISHPHQEHIHDANYL